MKLYKAILTYETVVRAKSDAYAELEANYTISKGYESPVSVKILEIKSLDDLAEGWDEDCIPWGETDLPSRTIGEIIRDQNKEK